jgi:hypothetical protein
VYCDEHFFYIINVRLDTSMQGEFHFAMAILILFSEYPGLDYDYN